MSVTVQLTPLEKELLHALDHRYGTAMELRNRIMGWLQQHYGRSVIYLEVVEQALSSLCRAQLATVAYIEDETYFEIAVGESDLAALFAG